MPSLEATSRRLNFFCSRLGQNLQSRLVKKHVMMTKSLCRHEEYSYREDKILEMKPAATPVTVTVRLFIKG